MHKTSNILTKEEQGIASNKVVQDYKRVKENLDIFTQVACKSLETSS